MKVKLHKFQSGGSIIASTYQPITITPGAYAPSLQQTEQAISLAMNSGKQQESNEEELTKNLRIAQNMDYRTCLYTGQKTISGVILKQLTWLKTGEWKSELGGLNSKTTNQLFIEVPTNTNLNYLFLKN